MPKTTKKKPPALAMYIGKNGNPTTLRSVRPWPGNWVCFWNQTSIRWTVDQRQDDAGHQQHVDGVEPWNEVSARELAAEDEERHVRADERDGEHDALRDAQPRAGQQVVWERVAGESFEQAKGQQRRRR